MNSKWKKEQRGKEHDKSIVLFFFSSVNFLFYAPWPFSGKSFTEKFRDKSISSYIEPRLTQVSNSCHLYELSEAIKC